MKNDVEELKYFIRVVEDFPIPGISFKDITPLLADRDAFHECCFRMSEMVLESSNRIGRKAPKIVGIDARGFILGAGLAANMHLGFVPCRKQGKLPTVPTLIDQLYGLEYDVAALEIDTSLISKEDFVIIVDDVLATGGTLWAAISLVLRCGVPADRIVCYVLVELLDLKGRSVIEKNWSEVEIVSLLKY